MYHATQAGLDYAIVNTEKLERFASIPKEEVEMAEKLLFHTDDKTLASFTDFYRGKKKADKQPKTSLSLEERLAEYVIEGTKEGLIPDLEQALKKFATPLDVVNGPLMDGMAEVGRLFNNNELIVAEVLQSAEVMKILPFPFSNNIWKRKTTAAKERSFWQPLKAMSMISAKT